MTAKMDNTKEIKQNARDFANNKAQRTHSRTLIKYVIVAGPGPKGPSIKPTAWRGPNVPRRRPFPHSPSQCWDRE